uniref:Uncharacterized protein n=1 Tax=Avena sativa TaxID=4498 RepID=A0ACD6ATU0_AVESA
MCPRHRTKSSFTEQQDRHTDANPKTLRPRTLDPNPETDPEPRNPRSPNPNRRLELNVYVGSALVDMYGKCDCACDAHSAFEVLPEKNVVSWTAVMTAYTQNELFEEALQLFLDLEMEGVRPNEFTYAVALNSCAGLAALKNGNALSASAMKTGHWGALSVCNALINMYSKSGSIHDARRVFLSMPCRDVVSWNSIIIGYAHHGLAREAMCVFHDMLVAEESPSYVTFVGLLSACAQLGLVDEGLYYLNIMMKEMGIKPGKEHYTCMVGLLCRAGRLDEAEQFILSNYIGADVVAWKSLLGSCQVHKNYGLGHRVAEQILQLKPSDVGTYVMLSNMYAKANRWDGVVKVRKLMRERGVRKEPGVSWIQVGSEVHVFTSEDKNHQWINQITRKLKELIDQIKVDYNLPDCKRTWRWHDAGRRKGELQFIKRGWLTPHRIGRQGANMENDKMELLNAEAHFASFVRWFGKTYRYADTPYLCSRPTSIACSHQTRCLEDLRK